MIVFRKQSCALTIMPSFQDSNISRPTPRVAVAPLPYPGLTQSVPLGLKKNAQRRIKSPHSASSKTASRFCNKQALARDIITCRSVLSLG
jgi:hypothetical protein